MVNIRTVGCAHRDRFRSSEELGARGRSFFIPVYPQEEAMARICTIKCPYGDEWMATILTKNGTPYAYCGIHKIGWFLRSNEVVKAHEQICQQIEETDLPEATLEWFRRKIQEE